MNIQIHFVQFLRSNHYWIECHITLKCIGCKIYLMLNQQVYPKSCSSVCKLSTLRRLWLMADVKIITCSEVITRNLILKRSCFKYRCQHQYLKKKKVIKIISNNQSIFVFQLRYFFSVKQKSCVFLEELITCRDVTFDMSQQPSSKWCCHNCLSTHCMILSKWITLLSSTITSPKVWDLVCCELKRF